MRSPGFGTSRRYTRAVLPAAFLACSSAGTPARMSARLFRDWGTSIRCAGGPSPHHVVDADDVAQANADGVLLEAQHDVAVEEGRQQSCHNKVPCITWYLVIESTGIRCCLHPPERRAKCVNH